MLIFVYLFGFSGFLLQLYLIELINHEKINLKLFALFSVYASGPTKSGKLVCNI